jgi:prefoldin subunit 5
MPSVIPYDPSLVLGQIVEPKRLEILEKMAAAQQPADSAEDQLNDLITLRRSFDMTIQELANLSVDVTDLAKERDDVNKQIAAAAKDYAKAKIDAEKAIIPLKNQIRTVNSSLESPIDYSQSEIKQLQLSADSLKMNVQYFAFDQNTQTSATFAATISQFVSGEVQVLGDSFSASASSSASSQVNSQHQNHSVAGTLVITVACTHKMASMFAPFVIDVDKAILVWNRMFPDQMIKANDPASLAQIAAQANTQGEKSMTLLSGATYGSCFIGMVHVLNTTDTSASETMYSVAQKMQAQFQVGSWFEKMSGGFGVSSSFSADVKNLLSMQNITSHCTLVTIGSIPSIKSNTVAMGVKTFADDDGAKSMAALQKLQNATSTAQDTVDSAANAARTGKQMITMQNAKIEAALSSLATIDDGQNKVIDTNSMMTALEDYVDKCLAGNVGVPINYYLKPVTRSEIAQMWVQKYYPGQFGPGGSAPGTPQGGGNSGGTTPPSQ